jgi:hypothetical protein
MAKEKKALKFMQVLCLSHSPHLIKVGRYLSVSTPQTPLSGNRLEKSMTRINGQTNLENLFKIRPAGVLELSCQYMAQSGRQAGGAYVSKKLIGDLKIANAILSCSFLEALTRVLARIYICIDMLQAEANRPVRLTSIEQNIHRINVCITTSRAEPIPKTK